MERAVTPHKNTMAAQAVQREPVSGHSFAVSPGKPGKSHKLCPEPTPPLLMVIYFYWYFWSDFPNNGTGNPFSTNGWASSVACLFPAFQLPPFPGKLECAPSGRPQRRCRGRQFCACSTGAVSSPHHPVSIGQPMALQAAMDPRHTSTSLKPCRLRMEAAMMARWPLPQNVVMGRSAGISRNRSGSSPT